MLTRFAPSPTGHLHLGHAFAARRAFGFGPCLLRMEDIDPTRCKAEFADSILRDLHWLGFDWPEPVRMQSRHLRDYQAVVDHLSRRGLTYETYTTRSGREDRAGPPAIKLSVEAAIRDIGTSHLSFSDNGAPVGIDLSALSDPTIVRRDIGTSYHIAVTHDDWHQGITDIVRGKDLLGETPIHVLIQTLMGWPRPDYHHHSLILEADGRKMSKRSGSRTVWSFRNSGLTPDAMLALAMRRVE